MLICSHPGLSVLDNLSYALVSQQGAQGSVSCQYAKPLGGVKRWYSTCLLTIRKILNAGSKQCVNVKDCRKSQRARSRLETKVSQCVGK